MAWATLETGALAWGVNARDVRLWPLAAARSVTVVAAFRCKADMPT